MGDASTSGPATPTSTLICLEDGNDLFVDDDGDSPAAAADLRLAAAGDDDARLLLLDTDDEYVALMLSKEGGGCGAGGEETMDEWTKAARAACVDWIVKTNARFLFSGNTAYVAVTYLDRFLAQRRVDTGQGWALELLAVACLSLAAKLEEHRAPRLPELGLLVDGYDFDSASITRMELLVLATLNWQMIAGTPFPYLGCFAARLRHDDRKAIVLGAVRCIFASIKAMSSVEYQPSTIALASILVACGANNKEEGTTSPDVDEELKAILGSSWQQLHTGHVYSCYRVMIREEDRSMQQSSREVASSGVSVAHIGMSSDSSSIAMGANNNNNNNNSNSNATTSTEATPDNKRKRLHSP
ncbi:cyclin-D5-3 [Brachypodium distachyon]|uniref:Cyclin-like domain-containing protein n=1 Tax=Brachypodium distachyon TaxID=15368 RepID=A0A0Q3HJI8_BRADI|nr:cyclin-D5-3 [Brachypodium distachyon]KQK23040.1 hypothetical protein BRADI_1g70907v3 [Brachypodium distachyon]|eukprot:XP_010229008.1 cyclin-D5-3 [Brachypodium distachyon]